MALYTTALLFASAALAGPPDGTPAFEVASIRSAQPGQQRIDQAPGSITMRAYRVAACIQWAYSVQEAQIDGPGWLNETQFDIVAKAAGPASEAEMRVMMQTLLADRFKLALHRETREVPKLVLSVAKSGHKLEPVETQDPPSFQTGKLNLTGKGAMVSQLADFFAKELHKPILDQTGLTGRYNYFLDINAYVTEEILKSAGPGGGAPPEAPAIIAQALQAQLGLRLESKKMPVEVLVIDRIEKTPSEN
jgi:uncharacterized protein (TIGR03435 family)